MNRSPAEQELCFMPMMAHFVLSFMDVNRYILRNPLPPSELDHLQFCDRLRYPPRASADVIQAGSGPLRTVRGLLLLSMRGSETARHGAGLAHRWEA
jgi:hypothetical protein